MSPRSHEQGTHDRGAPKGEVAVVVPAFRETEGLAKLLASLTALPERPRVVVAVDGAWDASVSIAREAGVDVLPLERNAGSYAARNAAIAHVFLQGEPDAVLFTDADCVVTATWLSAHLAALDAGADLSAGAVRFTFRRTAPTPAEWVDATRHLQQARYVQNDSFGATCNLAVKGSLLREHRFDQRRRTGGDVEFCRRVVAAGARLVYNPGAVVEHPARDLRELWTKVDRLVGGVPEQGDRWDGRSLPRRRPTTAAWRRAREAGVATGVAWGISVTVLDWVMTQRVRRARLRAAGRA